MFSALKQAIKPRRSAHELQANVLAGLTVGIIALPLSMALAIATGVPPQHGLYTAILAGIVIALSGGSSVNISGPTAAFVVILLPIVHQFGLGGLLVSGMLAGFILLAMGLLRLGTFIELIPYPVTVGFTAGIGVVIGFLQIKDFLGLDVPQDSGHFIQKAGAMFSALPTLRWQEALIASVTLGVLLLWPKAKSRIPGHLVALLAGACLAWLLTRYLPGFSVATIGSRFHYLVDGVQAAGIPSALPAFALPWQLPDARGNPIGMSFDLIRQLAAPALTIAILGALESLLCAVVADGMSGAKHDSDDELIGQGIGNIVAPFFGGIPATAALARTAANIRAGGSTPLASVVHALFIVVAMLLIADLLAYIPMASMAALLVMVAWNMSDVKLFMQTLKTAPRDDVAILLGCFGLTVLFDMTLAVGVGLGMAAILFIRKSIILTESRPVHDHGTLHHLFDRQTAVYEINGPLFFGTAQKALRNITRVDPEVRAVVLDMSDVSMLDMSAIAAMQAIVKTLDAARVALVINELAPRMVGKLQDARLHSTHSPIRFSASLADAARMLKDGP
ncbi:MAG TPA: C4-dicarboxylic acid transporter DauA [Arenimonas sp.]|nr:C4-dicarboxylic acid transporter DauA [Arenimonas sp.]